MHIKKGDMVVMRSGDDKGKKGKVVHVFATKGTAVVEGLNMNKKHQRSRQQGKKGQIVDIAMPVQVSRLALAEKPKKKKSA